MRQIQLMLLLSIMIQRGWSEDPKPQRIPPIAGVEDVIVKTIQVPAQYFLNESMEATLEIQNISEKKIRFGWKDPIVDDLGLEIDQTIIQVEKITPKLLESRNGAYLPVIIAPKMTWRGKIFLDSYFDFKKSSHNRFLFDGSSVFEVAIKTNLAL